MTVLVAVEHPGGVTIGSDSMISDESARWVEDQPKYWLHGQMVVALAGSARAAQVAQAAPEIRAPRRGERDTVYLGTVLGEAIRRMLAAVDCRDPAEGVIVWRGRAYQLDCAWCVTRPIEGIAVAGTGSVAARAVALALAGAAPEVRVRRALEIAAVLHAECGGPSHVLTVRSRARRA